MFQKKRSVGIAVFHVSQPASMDAACRRWHGAKTHAAKDTAGQSIVPSTYARELAADHWDSSTRTD